MVYLKANLWDLKMYTATVLEKKSKTTHAWKTFQGKVNIWNEMQTCEWKVTGKMVKWSETSENVLRQLQIVQIQHTYVTSSQKIKN
jgi:hypothetical protein